MSKYRLQLFNEHQAWAKKIVQDLIEKRGPLVNAQFLPGQMEQAALRGLWAAVQVYDPTRGVSFTVFANKRVRGSVQEEYRQCSGFFDSRRGLNEPERLLVDEDDEEQDFPSDRPQDLSFENKELVQKLMRKLKPIQRRVITLIFFKHMTLNQAGKVVGLCFQRVSQIKHESLAELRKAAGVKV